MGKVHGRELCNNYLMESSNKNSDFCSVGGEGGREGGTCYYSLMPMFDLHTTVLTSFQLQFNKGDLVKVTNIVEGGWWEGLCNGNSGWFPGNYVEEISKGKMVPGTGPD